MKKCGPIERGTIWGPIEGVGNEPFGVRLNLEKTEKKADPSERDGKLDSFERGKN